MNAAIIGPWHCGGGVGWQRPALPLVLAPDDLRRWLANLLLAAEARIDKARPERTPLKVVSHDELHEEGLHNEHSPEDSQAADAEDIRAAQGGDGEAFRRLVVRYQPQVAALMWRFTRQRGEWETLVQDVLVEAYCSLSNYRGRGSFAGWLRTLGTRVGYRYWKLQARSRRRGEVPLEDWDGAHSARTESPPESNGAAEAGRAVHGLLAQLPPRDRLVLTLLYLENCSTAEIAERVGWSRTMVKVQAHRARQKLKRLLEQARLADA